MNTYVVAPRAHLGAQRWGITVLHPDGTSTDLGVKQTRKAATTTASLLAGRTGKIEVRATRFN